jgi:hypothetical protein
MWVMVPDVSSSVRSATNARRALGGRHRGNGRCVFVAEGDVAWVPQGKRLAGLRQKYDRANGPLAQRLFAPIRQPCVDNSGLDPRVLR